MEPVHIINGRKIYNRTTWQQGLKLTQQWDGKKGTKPLFIDSKGEFFEIEKGGKKYQHLEHNPKGWTFGNYVKHVTRAIKRRAQQKGATPTIEEVFKVFKKKFPEVSDKELRTFTESVMSMNDEQINLITKSRLPGQHLDHTISLDKGGLHWWSNVRNRDSLFNLKKGALQPSELFQRLTNSYSREAQIGTLATDIRLKPGSAFEEKFLSRSLGKNFNQWFKGETAKKLAKQFGTVDKAVKPVRPVAKFIPYVGAGLTYLGYKSDVQAAEQDPTWQNKFQAALSTADIWMEGTELATLGFTSPVTTPLQIGSALLNVGTGLTERKKRDTPKTLEELLEHPVVKKARSKN